MQRCVAQMTFWSELVSLIIQVRWAAWVIFFCLATRNISIAALFQCPLMFKDDPRCVLGNHRARRTKWKTNGNIFVYIKRQSPRTRMRITFRKPQEINRETVFPYKPMELAIKSTAQIKSTAHFSAWSSKPVHRVLYLHFKVACSSRSWKLVLRVLHLYYKTVIFQLVLETGASRTRLVLQSCDCVLHLCYKVAIFERARLVLQSCDFPSRAGNRYFASQTCTTKLRVSS